MPATRLPVAAATLAALILAGCGGGGGSQQAQKPSTIPRPAVPLRTALGAFVSALPGSRCDEMAGFVHSRANAGNLVRAPLSAGNCAYVQRLRAFGRDFQARRQEEFGTAALVEGPSSGVRRNWVFRPLWVLDQDARWKVASFAISSGYLVGSRMRPREAARFDATAAAFVRAVQHRDCRAMFRATAPSSSFVASSANRVARFCADIAVAFRRNGFFTALAADPSARPVRLGAVALIAFYGLRLKGGRYYTLVSNVPYNGTPRSLSAGHSPYGVEDVYRGPDRGRGS